MTGGFYILWPEQRWVAAGTFKVWFCDALANGEVISTVDQYGSDYWAMALELHRAGLITLGQQEEGSK
jgi:hypothetical protein